MLCQIQAPRRTLLNVSINPEHFFKSSARVRCCFKRLFTCFIPRLTRNQVPCATYYTFLNSELMHLYCQLPVYIISKRISRKKRDILELITVQLEFAEFVTWVNCAGKWSQFCGLVGGWVGVRSTLCYPEWEEILWGVTEIQNRNKHTSLSHKEAFLYGWVGITSLHSNGLRKCAIYLKGIVHLKILISFARPRVFANPCGTLAYVNCNRRDLEECPCCTSPYYGNEWGLAPKATINVVRTPWYCLLKPTGLFLRLKCAFFGGSHLWECAAWTFWII